MLLQLLYGVEMHFYNVLAKFMTCKECITFIRILRLQKDLRAVKIHKNYEIVDTSCIWQYSPNRAYK